MAKVLPRLAKLPPSRGLEILKSSLNRVELEASEVIGPVSKTYNDIQRDFVEESVDGYNVDLGDFPALHQSMVAAEITDADSPVYNPDYVPTLCSDDKLHNIEVETPSFATEGRAPNRVAKVFTDSSENGSESDDPDYVPTPSSDDELHSSEDIEVETPSFATEGRAPNRVAKVFTDSSENGSESDDPDYVPTPSSDDKLHSTEDMEVETPSFATEGRAPNRVAKVFTDSSENGSESDDPDYVPTPSSDDELHSTEDIEVETPSFATEGRAPNRVTKVFTDSSENGSESDDPDYVPTPSSDDELHSTEDIEVETPSFATEGIKISRASNSVAKVTIHLSKKTKNGKRVYDKKNMCKFCSKPFLKLSKHLFDVHKNESQIASILSRPVRSKERQLLLEKVRNEGNFRHNAKVKETGCGEIIAWRSPCEDDECDPNDYIPCEFCLGFFHKKELWRHEKNCKFQSSSTKNKGRRVQSRSMALLPLKDSECSRGLKDIFDAMSTSNEIGLVARSDFLIVKFGERLYNRLGHLQHLKNHISQKLRDLARFLVQARKEHLKITDLRSAVHPSKFPAVISAVKKLCEFDSESNTFGKPTLAKELGTHLKVCGTIMRSQALIDGDTHVQEDSDGFVRLCESEWKEHISTRAMDTLAMKKPQTHILPLTEDVKKLTETLKEKRKHCTEELQANPCKAIWHDLAKVCLANIIMFNRRRSGEASRMLMADFEAAQNCGSVPEDDVNAALSKFEKHLLHLFTRVVIRGKRGRKVPVLLTEDMNREIVLLNKFRDKADVEPKNKFVFARPYFASILHLAGHKCLHSIVHESSLKHPEYITSTKLRQHLATVTQILNLTEHELEQVCTFFGHNISVHRDFYRIPQDTYQLVKVSRLLLLAERSQIHQFQGQSLKDITFDSVMSVPCAESDELIADDYEDMVPLSLTPREPTRAENGDMQQSATTSSHGSKTDMQPSTSSRGSKTDMQPSTSSRGSKTDMQPSTSSCDSKTDMNPSTSSRGSKTDMQPSAKDSSSTQSSRLAKLSPKCDKARDFLTSEQVKTVREYFEKEINDRVLPGKQKCLKMLALVPAMSSKTWQKIKWTVRNEIEKSKRKERQTLQNCKRAKIQ